VLTKINNQNQNVQLWETNLVFNRGNLTLRSDDLNLIAFDSDSVGTWEDPLHIVGDIGIYNYPWGFNQQGIYTWKHLGKAKIRLLYSDDFRPGGTTSPSLEQAFQDIAGRIREGDIEEPATYIINSSDNNKDVLGFRLDGPVFSDNLTLAASFRADRGRNPGEFVEFFDPEIIDEQSLDFKTRSYGATVENWTGGGADARYTDDEAGLDLYGEALYGEADITGGRGELLQVQVRPNESTEDPTDTQISTQLLGGAPEFAPSINKSKRFIVGGHYFAYRGWHWTGDLEFQDLDILPPDRPSRSRFNKMLVYRGGVGFSGKEWKLWPWEAFLDFEYHDFNYDAKAEWTDQFWFYGQNFWLEGGANEVSVDRLVMLGGNDVFSVKPRFTWDFWPGRDGTFRYRGTINSVGVGKKPKYWETLFGVELDLSRRVQFIYDGRFVSYDDPVLSLNDSWSSHFLELKYWFTPEIEVGLSWGVDPWVLDPLRNEYFYNGRDLFLFSRGANAEAARTRYLDLGPTIARAEEDLQKEKVFQLEAIVRF
jgi:hypothetical protein